MHGLTPLSIAATLGNIDNVYAMYRCIDNVSVFY